MQCCENQRNLFSVWLSRALIKPFDLIHGCMVMYPNQSSVIYENQGYVDEKNGVSRMTG